MARNRLSIPHERRKAQLKSTVLSARVKIAEQREKLQNARTELAAMRPPKKEG